jgi:hypothetical protein
LINIGIAEPRRTYMVSVISNFSNSKSWPSIRQSTL